MGKKYTGCKQMHTGGKQGRKYPQEIKERVYELARAGNQIKDIAKETGLIKSTVATWLRQAKIKPASKYFYDEQWLNDNVDIYFGCASPQSIAEHYGNRPSKDYLTKRRRALYPEIGVKRLGPRGKTKRHWATCRMVEKAWDKHYNDQQLLNGWKRVT